MELDKDQKLFKMYLFKKSFFRIKWISFLVFLVSISCQKEDNPDKNIVYKVYEAEYHRNDIKESNAFFLSREDLLTYPLPEASGIVSGRKNPGLVYIHEDSGNRPVVFVYDTLGNYRGDIILLGTQNRDWEDIAIGPGPEDGVSYIYVGDIGDNNSSRDHLVIHRFPEPELASYTPEATFSIEMEDIFTITYKYPDGPRDAETLMIDPLTKDLIVVTKRDVRVHVYILPFPQNNEGIFEAVYKGNLPLRTIVGGDISPDGSEILLKDYGNIYHWKVQEDVLSTLFYRIPMEVAYVPEVQGEAIGWTYNGKGYFTTTETEKHNADPVLFHYLPKE